MSKEQRTPLSFHINFILASSPQRDIFQFYSIFIVPRYCLTYYYFPLLYSFLNSQFPGSSTHLSFCFETADLFLAQLSENEGVFVMFLFYFLVQFELEVLLMSERNKLIINNMRPELEQQDFIVINTYITPQIFFFSFL